MLTFLWDGVGVCCSSGFRCAWYCCFCVCVAVALFVVLICCGRLFFKCYGVGFGGQCVLEERVLDVRALVVVALI